MCPSCLECSNHCLGLPAGESLGSVEVQSYHNGFLPKAGWALWGPRESWKGALAAHTKDRGKREQVATNVVKSHPRHLTVQPDLCYHRPDPRRS